VRVTYYYNKIKSCLFDEPTSKQRLGYLSEDDETVVSTEVAVIEPMVLRSKRKIERDATYPASSDEESEKPKKKRAKKKKKKNKNSKQKPVASYPYSCITFYQQRLRSSGHRLFIH
jgi:hypothetical protein